MTSWKIELQVDLLCESGESVSQFLLDDYHKDYFFVDNR